MRPFYRLHGLLKLSGLSRSTFYYRQKVSALCDKHAALKDRIKKVFHTHKGRYGYRRITPAIRQLGHTANHKTVQRLMVEMGLKSLMRPNKHRSYKGDVGRIAPDLIKRQFTAGAINQKWVTDITEFNVAGEKLYLSPVMDLCNGEIIAFETARRPVFKLAEGMLSKALNRLKKNERPILHSDQGWHYQMPPTSACSKNAASPRVCHAKATASTTRRWKASSPPSNPSSSMLIASKASRAWMTASPTTSTTTITSASSSN